MRRAKPPDHCRHFRIGRDDVGEDGNEPEAIVLHLAVAHIEIEPRYELAVTAGCDEERLADLDHVRQRVVRMGCQNDVDAFEPRGELAVHIEPVVRQQHDQRRAFPARLVDVELQIVLANAEGPARDHPARVCDGRIRERLADHGNTSAATLDHGHGVEGGFIPLRVAHVLREERKAELADDLLDAIGAKRELPMAGHGIRPQHRHRVHHVLAFADERRVAVLPGIAAVEEHDTAAALGADRLEDGGDAVEAAQPPIASGQRGEIHRGERICGRRARGDAIALEKSFAADMRDQTSRFAGAEIDRRFAEENRQELRMNVGDVDERDIANRLESQQRILGETLLRQRPRPAAGRNGHGCGSHLQKIAPGEHCSDSLKVSCPASGGAPSNPSP